jgi:hypothetical protein
VEIHLLNADFKSHNRCFHFTGLTVKRLPALQGLRQQRTVHHPDFVGAKYNINDKYLQ